MAAGEEIWAAHKRDLLEFLEQDVWKGICMDEIEAMINHKQYRIIINVYDFHSFRDLGLRVLRNPTEYIQLFCDAVTEIAAPKCLKQSKF